MNQGIGVVPHGGFSYSDPQVKVPLEADGEQELIQALRDYRLGNHLPLGNPELDVQSYIAKQQYKPNDPTPFKPQAPKEPKTLRDRVSESLSTLFMGAGALSLVPDEEAEKRASICVACPKNQNWKVGCPPCIANNERVVLLLTQGQLTSKRNQLLGCSSYGHENNVAVRVDTKYLGKSYTEQPPSNCWLLAERAGRNE